MVELSIKSPSEDDDNDIAFLIFLAALMSCVLMTWPVVFCTLLGRLFDLLADTTLLAADLLAVASFIMPPLTVRPLYDD